MRSLFKWLGTTALAVAASLVPASASAERSERDPAALRSAQETVERLRAELALLNAEVAELKRGPRSMRNDYRLRERMADAEALARRLTAAESKLRAHPASASPGGAPIVAPPPVSPQDGSVELEAKADLLVDQARKLDGEAGALARAAGELRSRRIMRRKAGSWERDPFAGLESSRRNVAASATLPKSPVGAATGENGAHGPLTGGGATAAAGSPTSAPPPSAPNPAFGAVPAGESADKASTRSPAVEGAASPKLSLVPSGAADRQAVEQRLFLDPATAAQVRQALGSGGAALDPEALERGAAALRARARTLQVQAQELRTRSRTP